MSLRPRAAPPAGQPAGQPAPAGRLHAVLSAGVAKGLDAAPVAARPPAPSTASAASAPRGRNPRLIRLNPAKAEALRRTLETGARNQSRRRRYQPSTDNKVEEDVADRIQDMLEDGVVDLTEVAGLTAAVADGMKKIQAALNDVEDIEDVVAFQVSKGPPPGVIPPPPAAAAEATPEERARMERTILPMTEEEKERLLQTQQAALEKYGYQDPPEEIDSTSDDEHNEPPELEELKARTDSLQRNLYAIQQAGYDLMIPQDQDVYTSLTSDEEKYGHAFKAAVDKVRSKRLFLAHEAEQEEARKIQAAARRRKMILSASLASLTTMLASGGLIYQLMNTAQEPIPEPPQGWAAWFVENAKDAGTVIAPVVLFALTGTF